MKMKSYSILGLVAILFLSLTSCEEEKLEMQWGIGAVPTISNLDPAVFFPGDLNNTYIQFTVNVDESYNYTGDIDIVVSRNNDKSRKLVTTVTTFPATVNIKLVDVATALGTTVGAINPGDIFSFEAVTEVGGKSYYSNAAVNAPLVCVYDPTKVTGTYRAVSAGWGVNGIVTIEVDPVDQYKVWVTGLCTIDGVTEDLGPLPMNISPLNFSVSAPQTVLASVVTWNPAYTNMSYEGSGKVDSCNGTYTMTFTIRVAQGSFGSFAFTMTKQ